MLTQSLCVYICSACTVTGQDVFMSLPGHMCSLHHAVQPRNVHVIEGERVAQSQRQFYFRFCPRVLAHSWHDYFYDAGVFYKLLLILIFTGHM